jgi:uncharacterized protein (DUF2267 family)/ribosome-associated translation inhibitor RaiA
MTVGYEEFLTEVRRDAALSSDDDAVRAARAALQTLGERLSGGEARDLARHLPERLRPMLHDGEQPEAFGIDEYLQRVARREGVEEPVAARHALAVFTALGRAVGEDELGDMEAQLPKDFRGLLAAAEAAARAGGGAPMSAEAFVRRVAELAGLDARRARRAADAVLDALGERISAGQVSDLAERLPEDLAKALRHGNARSKGAAVPLSLTEFTRRVSDLEGVAPAVAREHARAVFLTLREAVGPKEFADTVAQLSAEYRMLWEAADGAAAAGAAATGTDRADRQDPASGRPPRDADAPVPETVEIHAPRDLPRPTLAAARERLAALQRYVGRPIISARLTLRHPETRRARSRWVADASIDLEGRVLAAHATGRDPLDATDAAVDRLRRQIRRVVGKEVALRNEPRVIAKALAGPAHEVIHRPEVDAKPVDERRIVHRRLVPAVPTSVLDAVADLLDADQEFRLFRHDESGEWLVVHRREDDRIGLIHPPWIPLRAGVTDVLVTEPSPYHDPLALEAAQAALAESGERFLFFVDAADGRPKVLYLRHDGDYGLVEPAGDG